MGFAQFMASTAGRVLRIVAGLVIIGLGVWVAQTPLWTWVLILVGLLPLASGVFDFCLFGPLMGSSFWGKDIRGD